MTDELSLLLLGSSRNVHGGIPTSTLLEWMHLFLQSQTIQQHCHILFDLRKMPIHNEIVTSSEIYGNYLRVRHVLVVRGNYLHT
jgi:hypothetical protein